MTKHLVSILALISATPALAQTASEAAEDQEEATSSQTRDDGAEIIVSASRVPLEPREIGSAYSVVTREDIERNQYIFANELLQDIAGVQVTSDRPGAFTNVSIRGSDNSQVLFLIDGIELGDPSSITTQFQTDHLITADIARVEVLRGNQSSLYGSDAIGGVVNITTRRASREGIEVAAEAQYGNHDALNGGVSVLGRTGPLDFRVTATGYQHDGPSLADPATGPAVEEDAYSRYGFSGRAGLQISPELEVQAVGFWLDSESDLDNTNSDSFNTVDKREYAAALQAIYASSDDRFGADLTLSRYNSRRLFFGGFNRPEGDLYDGTKDIAQFDATFAPAELIRFAGGVQYENEYTTQVTNFSGDFDASIDTLAFYGEVALFPFEGLTITGAARLDDNSRFGQFDTYRGTIAYAFPISADMDFKLRGSYGSGAKAPGLYQLFDPMFGNADLDVETSEGGDVGFDLTSETLTVQASYFFGKVRNEIIFESFETGYAQLGRTRNSGLEVAFTLTPTDWITLTQVYTYLEAEVDRLEDGNFTDLGRPAHTGTTSLTVLPTDRASFTARLRLRSDNAASFGGVTDGFATVDLLGSYGVTDNVEVFGRIVNLFDVQYQTNFGENSLGLSAYGGVRLNF